MRARLYDRALDPREIAASAASFRDYIPSTAIIAALPAIEGKSESGSWPRSSGCEPRRPPIRECTPSRRARRERRTSRSEAIRISPETIVKPGGIAAIVAPGADFGLEPDAPEARRRERLADWVCGASQSAVRPRVVNRLWQAHFGTGFVETASDFGFNGGKPSHPELLDWLAERDRPRKAGASRRCTG